MFRNEEGRVPGKPQEAIRLLNPACRNRMDGAKSNGDFPILICPPSLAVSFLWIMILQGWGSEMKKGDILGVDFSLLSFEDVMTAIQGWRQNRERHYVTLTPPHSVVMCRRDRHLRQATNGARLALPDGVGIILAATLLGYPHHGRVSGPTLMLKLCEVGRDSGVRHFFYGSRPGVTDVLGLKLAAQLPGLVVAGDYCPPFRDLMAEEDAEIVRYINRCRPCIVWVGLGSPKQEKWMAAHLGRINATALIGVGAAFDFHFSRVKWAPKGSARWESNGHIA